MSLEGAVEGRPSTVDEEEEEEAIAQGGSTVVTGIMGERGDTQGMSKNQLKKAAKRARQEAQKPEKRAAERQRRKERNAYLSQGFADGTLSAADKDVYEARRHLMEVRKIARKRETNPTEGGWKGAVVIDMGFDELMTEQEISSMASQLSHVYAANRIAAKPFDRVFHTSFSERSSPRLHAKLVQHSCYAWSRTSWFPDGLDEFRNQLQGTLQDHSSDKDVEPILLEGSGRTLVYLSADAEEQLDTLKEEEVYIIGGLVDRNRHKKKAESMGIRTARLPIGEYIANLPTRKVLTVNQVFEILLKYLEARDWSEAFHTVIPARKFTAGKAVKSKSLKSKDEQDLPEDASHMMKPNGSTASLTGFDEEMAFNEG